MSDTILLTPEESELLGSIADILYNHRSNPIKASQLMNLFLDNLERRCNELQPERKESS